MSELPHNRVGSETSPETSPTESPAASGPGERTRLGRRLLIGLTITALLGLSAWQFVRYGMLHIRVALADGQTEFFAEFAAQARDETRPERLTDALEAVVNYYPSGTKQVAGSQLDRIVERARSTVIAEIVARLRAVTGKDLGDDPAKWLTAYPPAR